jgi:hypothetical protein
MATRKRSFEFQKGYVAKIEIEGHDLDVLERLLAVMTQTLRHHGPQIIPPSTADEVAEAKKQPCGGCGG